MYSEKESKAKRAFEDELGWNNITSMNILIGKTLGFIPEVKYVVGTENSTVYSPSNCGFDHPISQKAEAERWLKDNHQKFPDGWVFKEGHAVRKCEYYPCFHEDWNDLIEAIKRIQTLHPKHAVVMNLQVSFATFKAVHEAVVEINTLNQL